MADLIDRQAAIDAFDCINGAEEVLRALPPAQPEIIRCKDCKYRYLDGMIWNCPFGLSGGEDFFCAYGAFCPEYGADMRGGDST